MPYKIERRRVRKPRNIAAATGTMSEAGWGSFNPDAIAEEMAQHKGKIPNVGQGKIMIGDRTAHFDENGQLIGGEDLNDMFPVMQHGVNWRHREPVIVKREPKPEPMASVLQQHYERPPIHNRFLDAIPIVIDDAPRGRWDRTVVPFNPGAAFPIQQIPPA